MEPSKTLSARSNNSTTVRANLGLEVLRNAVRLGSRVAPFATGGFLVDRFTHTNHAVQRSRDLAELYGGSLVLTDSSLGGLRARLTLPGTLVVGR